MFFKVIKECSKFYNVKLNFINILKSYYKESCFFRENCYIGSSNIMLLNIEFRTNSVVLNDIEDNSILSRNFNKRYKKGL